MLHVVCWVLGLNLCKPKQECISEGVPLICLIYVYVLSLAVECLWIFCWHYSLCVIYNYLSVNLYLSDFSTAFVWSEWLCVPMNVCLINPKGFSLSLKQSVLLGRRTSKIKWLHGTKTFCSFGIFFNANYNLLFLHPSLCFVVPLFHLNWGSLVLHCVSCQSLQVHRFSGRKICN